MGKKLTTEEFIKRAREKHCDKYDYSKTEYVNSQTKVCIICPEHGEFWQIPSSHLKGIGCAKCTGKARLGLDEFINKSSKIHGDKYDYSKAEYVNSQTKVCIICPEHGEFWQTPKDHLSGRGCSICGGGVKHTTETFIEKARKIHGDKYDYSKVEYHSAHEKVCIICPEHGEFWQEPDNHYRCGCPHCKESKLEKYVRNVFNEVGIKYETQKKFDWCFYVKNMKFDFYLPEYNVAIECQGEQHYIPFRFEKNNSVSFKNRINRDILKQEMSEKNNLKLFYYGDKNVPDNLHGYKVYKNLYELINVIKKL